MNKIRTWMFGHGIIRRLAAHTESLEKIEKENNFLAESIIDLRLKHKKQSKEKINIVFVCHRPSVWGALKTVYEALKDDPIFNVTVIAIPNKKELPKLGFNHEIYESEGAEEFFGKEEKYQCINGYNYDTKKWFDLRSLKPDYVFFQQPYNITRCNTYKSWIVSKYAKICYVQYGGTYIMNVDLTKEGTPPDFMQDVSMYFTQNSYDTKVIKQRFNEIGNNFTHIYQTGFPRYDELEKYREEESDLWSKRSKKEQFYRVLWTPRWTTDERNCHFFDYKDKWIQYCEKHNDIDFIFRPHPQAFINWKATGEFSEEQLEKYQKQYENHNNMKIDFRGEYLSTFYSSDCLVSDISSIMWEYFLTGKPIIYCHKKDCFNAYSRKLAEGFYWVKNWDELCSVLEMLKKGEDPLYEKRQQLINALYYIPSKGAGKAIAEVIKEDASK